MSRRILTLMGVLALAACEQLTDLIDPKPQPVSRPPVVSSKPPPAKPQAEAKPAPVPAKPTTAAAAVKNPLGLSEADTRRLFGAPVSVAVTPPGQQWTYRGRGCTVLLLLYPDLERGGLYTVDASGEGDTVEQCLAKVQAAQQPRRTQP